MKQEKCMVCDETTANFYPLKTNQGTVHKCRECYEKDYLRDQRDEYGSTYQNKDLSIKIKRRF
jgi:hypothetical protein